MKLGKHEHEGTPLMSLHCEFCPQGDGTHGFITSGLGFSRGGAVR
jgi:hypothetical protein